MSKKASYLESPVYTRPPGPLATYLETMVGAGDKYEWKLPGSPIIMTTERLKYYGLKPIPLGLTSGELKPREDIMLLHLDPLPPVSVKNFREVGTHLEKARELLKKIVREQVEPNPHISKIVFETNERLASVLMKLVPGFVVVDHLSPQGSLAASTTLIADLYKKEFSKQVASLRFPVGVATRQQFIKSVLG